MRILLNLDLEDSDLPGMLHGVIPRMPSPLTLRIRNTELLVVVPNGDLMVSDGTTGGPVCHLPSVQHDSGLFCLWTREKAGFRPAQSPNSH